MDEGRKRVIGIIAGILVAHHMPVADDLFGGPQGSPRTDKLIAASVQWAELIVKKVMQRSGTEIRGGRSATRGPTPPMRGWCRCPGSRNNYRQPIGFGS